MKASSLVLSVWARMGFVRVIIPISNFSVSESSLLGDKLPPVAGGRIFSQVHLAYV